MAPRKNPNKIQNLDQNDLDLVRSVVKDYKEDMIRVGDKKFCQTDYYRRFADEIYNFEVRKSDVWVVTLPRSGTTVTQEMVWQICNDLDFEGGYNVPLTERFPFFEFPLFMKESPSVKLLKEFKDDPKMCARIKTIFTLPWEKKWKSNERRFIKTHLPLTLLPPELLTSGCKVVYVARSFKDHLVSRYNHYKMHGRSLPEKFEDFWRLAEKGLISHYPYFEHINEGWNSRDSPNFLFLFYEDLVKNTEATIKKVAKFFGKTMSQDQIEQLLDHLKVENFKNNKSVSTDYGDIFKTKQNEHVRKGKIGTWKEEYFTEDLSRKVDKWIENNYKNTDLRFPIS